MQIFKLLDIFQARVWILLPQALLLEPVNLFPSRRFLVHCFYFYFSFKPCFSLCGWQTKNNLNLKHCGTYSWVQTLWLRLLNLHKILIPQTASKQLHLQDCCDLRESMPRGVKIFQSGKAWHPPSWLQRWEMECFLGPEQTHLGTWFGKRTLSSSLPRIRRGFQLPASLTHCLSCWAVSVPSHRLR